MKNWLKENSFFLKTSSIFFVIFLAYHYTDYKIVEPLHWFMLYISVLYFSRTLPDWKLLKPIKLIIEIPILFLSLIQPFTGTILLLMIMLVFSVGILSLIFLVFPEYPFQIDLNLATKLYIIIIISSILLTLFGEKLLKYFNSIINNTRTDEKENSQLVFALSFLNKSKIKFLIYLGFLLYLIPYSIALLSNMTLFETPNLDKAVFNAFITYTAFERVLVNVDLMKIDWKSFFIKYFKTIK